MVLLVSSYSVWTLYLSVFVSGGMQITTRDFNSKEECVRVGDMLIKHYDVWHIKSNVKSICIENEGRE